MMISMSDGSPSSSFLAMESPALVAAGWRGWGWWLRGGGRRWWLAKQSRRRGKNVGGGGLKVLITNC
jgi:hypothetical protein